MARVIVSSSALLHALTQHIGTACVQFRIAGGYCSLWSEQHTNGVSCESGWAGTATVPLEKALGALHSIADEPITLDLHTDLPGKLYAGPYGEVEFDL